MTLTTKKSDLYIYVPLYPHYGKLTHVLIVTLICLCSDCPVLYDQL